MKNNQSALIQCNCGALQGNLTLTHKVNHCRCYCASCQAFARYLKNNGAGVDIVNAVGGTDIVQMPPTGLTFTSGTENLSCLRLRQKGLLRWYASCCHTPIGNTLDSIKISFVGLIHCCIKANGGQKSMEELFGPVRTQLSTEEAIGSNKPESFGIGSGRFRVIAMILKARLNSNYKINPFFDSESGLPIAAPQVLSSSELEQLLNIQIAA